MTEKKKLVEMVDMTPTWEELYPSYAGLIDHGTAEQKEFVKSELLKLCKVADEYNKMIRAARDFINTHQD